MIILTKAIISIMLGFIISIIIGSIILKYLKRFNLSQNVSRSINERHLLKDGTPTMGGLIFIIPTILIIVILLVLKKISINSNFNLVLFSFLSYSFLGFTDDYLKVKNHNNKGISIITKFLYQMIIAIIFYIIYLLNGNNTTVSFFNIVIDLKCFYGLFILFLLSASSNAVNITDGLDGLAGGCCAIIFLTYGIISYHLNYIYGYEQIAIFCFVITGSLLGFLFFNFYPAKVFMGDLGSLSLGSTVASIGIILKCELSLVLICLVFIIETITSMIQIISIRYFHKKIFLKAPLHHHLEEKNMVESDIIKLFYMITLISSLIAIIYYVWI